MKIRGHNDVRSFVDWWISTWNRKDVESMLTAFSDDVVFTSPRIVPIFHTPRVEGKARLREYWTQAASRVQTIHFTLDYLISDGNRLGIAYASEINGKRIRSVEILQFDGNGLVCAGEAMHGVEM